MNQFFTYTPSAFRELEVEAKGICIRYRNQKMPQGAYPEYADIGFEADEESGTATLFVIHGIHYSGHNESIREWFEMGMIEFPNFQELTDWIKGSLKDAFQEAPRPNSPVPNENFIQESPVTDMNAIQASIPDRQQPMYLDEEELLSKLKENIMGQDFALSVLSSVIVRHLVRKHPSRPAVAFAVGPTGVGKTRSAEVLAKVLGELDEGGNGYQYLRLDMSEYQEAHRISQLLGAPQGYVGHGDGSQLIDTLKANPHTIVLCDEFEKAHPDIGKAIMNILDAGRASSASGGANGREIDCRHAIFIFTSNLDADAILDELETRSAYGNREVTDEVCRRRLKASGIPPEIVGRIGRFLVYRPLTGATRAAIIALAIIEVTKEYGINAVYVEPEVVIEIMKKGRSDDFGIRPEKYLIDDMLGAVFSKAAQNGMTQPVRVTANPYECLSHKPTEEDL